MGPFISYKEKVLGIKKPGAKFTTLHFLHNLRIDPIIQSVKLHWTGKFPMDKHSSLLGPFTNYEENEVLWKWCLTNCQVDEKTQHQKTEDSSTLQQYLLGLRTTVAENTKWEGRLIAVNLLIKVACFVKRQIIFSI